jgi:hypothetical protein
MPGLWDLLSGFSHILAAGLIHPWLQDQHQAHIAQVCDHCPILPCMNHTWKDSVNISAIIG